MKVKYAPPMGIERNNSDRERKPVWSEAHKLRNWLAEAGLPVQTVKLFVHPEEILSNTALGLISPAIPVFPAKFTPWEKEISFGYPPEIENIPILVVSDFDGVMIDLLKKNDWAGLLPFGRILRRADESVIWTNRLSPDENSLFWKVFGRPFDHPGAVDRFPFFTQQSVKLFQEKFFPKNQTSVVWGPKWVGKRGFGQVTGIIERMRKDRGEPYVVYIGSSVFDIVRFKRLISYYQENGLPNHQIVFCFNGHRYQ